RYHAKGTAPKFYETRLEYEIALRARTLRDHAGAYEMLDTARRSVCGRRIDQAADVTLAVRDDFIDYGEGVFAYALVVEVPVLIVQDAPGASGPWLDSGCCDGPPLTQVNYALDEFPVPAALTRKRALESGEQDV
ncbi:MAG: Gp37 family protein, partial [Burkholderia gladioli]